MIQISHSIPGVSEGLHFQAFVAQEIWRLHF